MISANLIESLLKQESNSLSKAVSLQPGQLINGKVIKLFPNQTAEIQVGANKMIASLEVPLTANDRYWFQVQPGEGKVHLKVLIGQGNSEKSTTSSFEGLLKLLGMNMTKENIDLIRFFIKEQLPLTKESFTTASQWLNQLETQKEGLEALKQIFSRNLPLSKDIFLSLTAAIRNEPMHSLISRLSLLLENDHDTETGKKLYELSTNLLTTGKEKAYEKAITHLFSSWLGQDKEKSEAAFQILQRIGWLPKGSEDKVLDHALQKSPFLVTDTEKNQGSNISGELVRPIQTMEGRSQSSSLDNVLENSNQKQNVDWRRSLPKEGLEILTSIIKHENNNPESVRRFLHSFKADPQFTDVQKDTILKGIINLFSRTEGEKVMDPAFHSLREFINSSHVGMGKGNSNSVLELIKQLSMTLESEATNLENSSSLSNKLKLLMRSIGFNYEHDTIQLLQNGQQPGLEEIDALKPLLIKFLNEDHSFPIKETAEQLLNKISGLQMLSQEIGPIQQYLVQVPFNFLDKTVDLTVQWNGRKKEDGKIDPDYCRLLFYLELSSLKETIVDVKIQNRIMNVTIINNHESIKAIAAPMLNGLKANLNALNYQLSSITFEKTNVKNDWKSMKAFETIYDTKQYNGVDIRI